MDARLTACSPLLVIGMHRSGTGLAADLLSRLGVFMGADLEGDNESVTFLRINEGIFHQCATFWSEPLPVHVLLAQPEQVERIAALVRDTLGTLFADYTGASGFAPGATPTPTPPFGWKDPRNTFTLPVWRTIFPQLKAIHVLRHGVDVAASLARRQRAACLKAGAGTVPSALAVFQESAVGVLSSRRGWILEEAFAMWEQYVEKARLEGSETPGGYLEIRYEDLLMNSQSVIDEVAGFCNIAPPREHTRAMPKPDASRAFAFRRDSRLSAFAGSVRDALARFGYEP
jgi:hypothetical protein